MDFMKMVGIINRPILAKPYSKATSVEKIIDMSQGRWNPTKLDWVTLYGVMYAMENALPLI